MFAGFKVRLEDDAFDNCGDVYDAGMAVYDFQKLQVKEHLDGYLLDDGAISASKIEAEWFPHFNADIFLSHSHRDKHLAVEFAGWLYRNLNVTAFIDSCVWGYADDLLETINDRYAITEQSAYNKTYDYHICMNAASHVHMMLNNALARMIDETECLMLLNTPNSLTVKQSIDKTYSPWIYSELQFSRLVEHKKLKHYRDRVLKKSQELYHLDEEADLRVEYDVDTTHLIELTVDEMNLWINKSKHKQQPWASMDKLYGIKGILAQEIFG